MKYSLFVLSLLSFHKIVKCATSELPQESTETLTPGISTAEPEVQSTESNVPQGTEHETPEESTGEQPTEVRETPASAYTPSLFTVLTYTPPQTPAPPTPSGMTATEQRRVNEERLERLQEVLNKYVPAVEKGQITYSPREALTVEEELRRKRRLIKPDRGLSGIGAEMELGEVLSGVVSGIRKQGRGVNQPDIYARIADADTQETTQTKP